MNEKKGIWLNLARLAESYDSAGLTPRDRAAAALQQFHHLPLVEQREMLAVLYSMAIQLPDLYTITASTMVKQRIERTTKPNGRAEAG